MKTIFISIPWFTPAYKAGGPVQSIANMVQELNEGYRFYIYCSNEDLDGLPIDVTGTNQWLWFNDYTMVWYARKESRGQGLMREIKKIKPDYLYMVGIYSWQFTIVPLYFTKVRKKIVSVRGMLHPGALGEKALKKKIFLKLMHWMQFQKKAVFHVTDAREREHVTSMLGAAVKVYEAGNFPRRLPAFELPKKYAGSLRLISIALLSPMKNILLVLQALQQCRAELLYDIYGPVKEPHYWAECLQQIKLLPSNVTVQYHREVLPQEVAGKLAHAQVFILPSKSENFGHSIYEALSAGLPVISSGFTPWNGLKQEMAGLNVETTMEEVGEAIKFFAAMDNEAFLKWRHGATTYAEKRLDMNGLKEAYAVMFDL